MITFILTFLSKLMKALQSSQTPQALACGFAMGVFASLPPFNGLFFCLVIVVFCVVDMSVSAGFLGVLVGSLLSLLTVVLADTLGVMLLGATAMEPFWTGVFSWSIFRVLEWNYSIVLGQVIIGVVLFFPLYVGFQRGVIYYRASLKSRLESHPLVKALSYSKIGRWVVAVVGKFL